MNRLSNKLAALLALATISMCATAKTPDCTGTDAWPAAMAFGHMKNDGIVDNDELDFNKTTVVRLASERIGRDLYRQVHLIRFVRKTGKSVEAITVNEASHEECSMSGVDVYPVTKRLGDYSKSP